VIIIADYRCVGKGHNPILDIIIRFYYITLIEMETKAISIAKLTPLGIAILLAISILSPSINANHAKGFGFMTAAGNTTAAGGGADNMTKAASNATSSNSSNSLAAIPGLYGENR
jgi:hypothetical protein